LIVVAVLTWFFSAQHTTSYWKGVIAQEKAQIEAAYKAEIARQEEASKEIAQAATERAETDAQVAADMQKIISDYEKKTKEKHHVPATTHCVVDDDLTSVLRKLSNAGSRKAKPSPAARRVRKAS
jgi:ABC-type uncharacterized transport system fused permease/ATPase subunit